MIISIAIQKGGSGKTTTTINLGAALARLGKSVLLIDLDPQASLTHGLGEMEPQKSIYHLIMAMANGQNVNVQDSIIKNAGLDLLPSSIELAGAELELVNIYGRERILQSLLHPLITTYDFILIDCPPAINMLTVNALHASDSIVLPMQAEFLHFKGLLSFLEHVRKLKRSLNLQLDIMGIVLTKFDRRKTMHQQVKEQIKQEFPGTLFQTSIRTNIALAMAQEKGKDIFSYEMKSNGATDYTNLAQEFLTKYDNRIK